MHERLEYKYLIPNSLLDSFRSNLQPFVELDPYAKEHENGEYTVRSIYMDTLRFECYHTKIEGIKVRKKYRIRGYNSSEENNIVFLEIKRKFMNNINKNRAPLNYQDLQPFFITKNFDKFILSFSQNGKEKHDAQRFLYHFYRKGLRPVVLIVYEREAYFSKFNGSLRLTFDKNLRSRIYPSLEMLFNEEKIKFAMPQHFIFEVKFNNGLLGWLKSILTRYNLQRRAVSKYTICLDSHGEPKKISRAISSNNNFSVPEYLHIRNHKNV